MIQTGYAIKNNYSPTIALKNKPQNVAFEGIVETGVKKFAESKAGKGAVNWLVKTSPQTGKANLDFVKRVVPTACGLWTAGFYLINNALSKNTPPERKPSQAIQDVMIAGFAALVGTKLVDTAINISDVFKDRLDKAITAKPNIPKNQLGAIVSPETKNLIGGGLKTLAILTATTVAFRFLAPIVAPQLAEPVINFLMDKGIIPDHRKAENINKEAKANGEQFKQEDVNKELLENISSVTPDVSNKVPVNPQLAKILNA